MFYIINFTQYITYINSTLVVICALLAVPFSHYSCEHFITPLQTDLNISQRHDMDALRLFLSFLLFCGGVLLYCCPDYLSCPGNAIQMGSATLAVLAAIKKYSLNVFLLKISCEDTSFPIAYHFPENINNPQIHYITWPMLNFKYILGSTQMAKCSESCVYYTDYTFSMT